MLERSLFLCIYTNGFQFSLKSLLILKGRQWESLFKISSDGPNSVGFTKQQAFPLGRQDYHSELDGGPIAIYYSDNNMV